MKTADKTMRADTGKILPFPTLPKPILRVIFWDQPGRPTEDALRHWLTEEGYQAVKWSSEPATGYPPHIHIYPELLWAVSGSLTVILPAENRLLELVSGDRIEIPQGTAHGTMAGADGATYLLATR